MRSQRTQCKKCLEERSQSEMIGEFFMHNSADRESIHIYVLKTHIEPGTIINSCKSSIFCIGASLLLTSAGCGSFIETLPLLNSINLPKQSESQRPSLAKRIFHSYNSRDKIDIELFEESLKKPKHCFKTIKFPLHKIRCPLCVAKQQGAVILSMGVSLDYYEQQLKSLKALAPKHIYYIYTSTEVNWEDVTSKCKAHCGGAIEATEDKNCLSPFNNHFETTMQYEVIEKRLEDNDQKMDGISSDLSGICMWVLHRDQLKCYAYLNARQSTIIVRLSRETTLIISPSGVLKWIDEDSGCLIFKKLPSNICSYAEEAAKPLEAPLPRPLAFEFDLNKPPPEDAGSEGTSIQHTDQGKKVLEESVSSPIMTNDVSIIHLESRDEMHFFKCVTCLCLYEEVLVISVDQTYLWLTEKNKGSVDGLDLCREECSLDPKYRKTFLQLDSIFSLKSLSTDDVVSIFCGEKVNDAKYRDHRIWLKKLESHALHQHIGAPLQMTNQLIPVEGRKRKGEVKRPQRRNVKAK